MIEKDLKSMENGKSCGPEEIPTEMLKYRPLKLKEIVAFLFTLYINGEPIPGSWKTAWITPIHKKRNNFFFFWFHYLYLTFLLQITNNLIRKNIKENK